jgi:hypothetical protein
MSEKVNKELDDAVVSTNIIQSVLNIAEVIKKNGVSNVDDGKVGQTILFAYYAKCESLRETSKKLRVKLDAERVDFASREKVLAENVAKQKAVSKSQININQQLSNQLIEANESKKMVEKELINAKAKLKKWQEMRKYDLTDDMNSDGWLSAQNRKRNTSVEIVSPVAPPKKVCAEEEERELTCQLTPEKVDHITKRLY